METRKLQEVGGGTYTVSIPKEWATSHSLEAGMALHLYTHSDGTIVLRAKQKDVDELALADITVAGEDPALVERAVQAAHAIGFETVTLVPEETFSDAQVRAARRTARNLVGTDLLVVTDDEITVQHLLDASNVSVRQMVVQLQFTTLSIHRRATAALTDPDTNVYAQLTERDDEADRLARMVSRHLTRALVSLEEIDRLGVSRPQLFDLYRTAQLLESVADHGVAIARLDDWLDDPLAPEVCEVVCGAAETARSVVEDATTAVLEEDRVDLAHEALDRRAAVLADVDCVDRALFEDDESAEARTGVPPESVEMAVAVTRTLDYLARTAESGAAIADVAICAATRTTNS